MRSLDASALSAFRGSFGGEVVLPGFSMCDDGIVIDLSRMRGAAVDPERRIAGSPAWTAGRSSG